MKRDELSYQRQEVAWRERLISDLRELREKLGPGWRPGKHEAGALFWSAPDGRWLKTHCCVGHYGPTIVCTVGPRGEVPGIDFEVKTAIEAVEWAQRMAGRLLEDHERERAEVEHARAVAQEHEEQQR